MHGTPAHRSPHIGRHRERGTCETSKIVFFFFFFFFNLLIESLRARLFCGFFYALPLDIHILIFVFQCTPKPRLEATSGWVESEQRIIKNEKCSALRQVRIFVMRLFLAKIERERHTHTHARTYTYTMTTVETPNYTNVEQSNLPVISLNCYPRQQRRQTIACVAYLGQPFHHLGTRNPFCRRMQSNEIQIQIQLQFICLIYWNFSLSHKATVCLVGQNGEQSLEKHTQFTERKRKNARDSPIRFDRERKINVSLTKKHDNTDNCYTPKRYGRRFAINTNIW